MYNIALYILIYYHHLLFVRFDGEDIDLLIISTHPSPSIHPSIHPSSIHPPRQQPTHQPHSDRQNCLSQPKFCTAGLLLKQYGTHISVNILFPVYGPKLSCNPSIPHHALIVHTPYALASTLLCHKEIGNLICESSNLFTKTDVKVSCYGHTSTYRLEKPNDKPKGLLPISNYPRVTFKLFFSERLIAR